MYHKYIKKIYFIFPTNFSDEIRELVYLLFADSLRVGFLPILPQHNRIFIQFFLAIYKHIYAIYIICQATREGKAGNKIYIITMTIREIKQKLCTRRAGKREIKEEGEREGERRREREREGI